MHSRESRVQNLQILHINLNNRTSYMPLTFTPTDTRPQTWDKKTCLKSASSRQSVSFRRYVYPHCGPWQPANRLVITLPCKAIRVLPQTQTALQRFIKMHAKLILTAETGRMNARGIRQVVITTILLCDHMWLCPLTMHSCLLIAHACSTHTKNPQKEVCLLTPTCT